MNTNELARAFALGGFVPLEPGGGKKPAPRPVPQNQQSGIHSLGSCPIPTELHAALNGA